MLLGTVLLVWSLCLFARWDGPGGLCLWVSGFVELALWPRVVCNDQFWGGSCVPLFEQPGSRASWGIDGPVSGIVHERPTNIPAVVLVPWIITDVCMYVFLLAGALLGAFTTTDGFY